MYVICEFFNSNYKKYFFLVEITKKYYICHILSTMNKNKYIWIFFIFILFLLLLLQGVWLYNVYTESKANLEKKINDILWKSIEREVDIRYALSVEIHKDLPTDSVPVFNFVLNDNDIESDGLLSQQMQAMQQLLVFVKIPFKLSMLDSIFSDNLKKESIFTSYSIQYRDSTGTTKTAENEVSKITSRTDIFPIVEDTTVQAFVNIPVPVVLKQNMFILGLSSALLIMLTSCLIYFLRVVYTQEALLRLRDTFTSALNHNMHNPLSTVLMAVNILKNEDKDSDIERRNIIANAAIRQIKSLLSTVDTILSISRFEYNKLALDKYKINITEIIEQIREKYSLPIKNKTVNLTADCNVSTQVVADGIHITCVIENLIDNSIKYSGNSVDIYINCYTEHDRLFLTIKDNGFGISKKYISRIFNKFERGNIVMHKGIKGFGLGLNYVKMIVEEHGGKVSVKSTEGEGSEFKINIPVC